jgi:beta-N-acetylhexosaminidase
VDPAPASLSRWWIAEQLRGALGFSGAVISDDLSMVGAAVAGPVPERVRRALDAGCDMVLLCNAPGEVPLVLEALTGYLNPSGQLRLARLHGRGGDSWHGLHESAEWAGAAATLAALSARPELTLRG